jgi:glyoxylase-like metal-dependent hydrolase (beta-lactamase superfamily II)
VKRKFRSNFVNCMRIKSTFKILIFFLLANFFSCEKQPELTMIVSYRISNRVVVFNYLNVNITAIASSSGLIIIDTQRSPAMMRIVLREIEKEFRSNKVLYVVNTHGHADHCSGNQIFPDSIIVAHQNCPEFMRQYPANSPQALWYARSNLEELKKQNYESEKRSAEAEKIRAKYNNRKMQLTDLEKNYRITPPSITFQDSLDLNAGDLTLKLWYAGNAHTTNDIFIYVPEEKLVFVGDLLNSGTSIGFPVNRITDVPRILSVMDKIAEQPAGIEYLISGHSEVLSKNDFLSLRKQLKERYQKFEGKNSAAKKLGHFIKERGIKQAIADYRKSNFSEPTGYYLLEEEFNALGYQFLGRGLIDEAIAVFKTALKHFTESALLYDNLAEAYLKQKQNDLAIKNYQKSLELMPYNRNAEEMLKFLGSKN